MHEFRQHKHFASLNACWKEGIASNITITVFSYYLLPFALFLGATPPQVGLLISLPHLLGALSQISAQKLVEWTKSRLTLLKTFSLLQALLIIPFALLLFQDIPFKITILIVLSIFFAVFNNLIQTLWGSLTSEYVLDQERGRYFGWRSRIIGIWGLVAFGLGGIFLSWAKTKNIEATAFTCGILIIALSRFISVYYYKKMEDLTIETIKRKEKSTLKNFLNQFKENYFLSFTLFMMLMTFSTQIAAPYFSVYILENLKFTYSEYMYVHMAGAIAGLISFPIWGSFADRIGNVRVLKLCSLFIPIIPTLWIISRHVTPLILVEALGGIIWAGFNLASLHYFFDSIPKEKRVLFLSYFNLLNGFCLFLGATLGGFLIEHLPPLYGQKICTLFAISIALRILTHTLFISRIKEVRKTIEKISWKELIMQLVKKR